MKQGSIIVGETGLHSIQRHGSARNTLNRLFRQNLWFVLLLLSFQLPAAPSRVVSINLCTDQLLLMLADESQIASITFLASDETNSFMAGLAQRHPVNHARVEELIALQPDLIVANEYNAPALMTLLERLGFRVARFANANSIETIRSNIRQMAMLLKQERRGEQLIAQMDRRIDVIAAKERGYRPRALFYQVRGYTSGLNTLQDEALQLAGWHNLSAEAGITGYSPIDIETLLLAKPEQLFTSTYAPGTESVGQRQLRHPALRQIMEGRHLAEIDYRYWICGGPMIADAIEALDVTRWR